jgi:hypothetical protein
LTSKTPDVRPESARLRGFTPSDALSGNSPLM